MRYSKRIISLILALLILALACACTPQITGDRTVTDMAGQEVKISQKITKLVILDAADCEILYSLGAQDTLVGRGEYCDYPAEVLDVVSVQSGSETNIEQIISLQPQVVIMTKMAQTVEQNEALEKAGIAVVVTDAQDVEGVYTAITLIGEITGKTKEAANLVKSMKEAFTELKCDYGKTVYFEVSPLEWGLWTAGKGTFMQEIADMIGLKNIFDDVTGWAEISQEQVIDRNPDIIVTNAMYYGTGEKPDEEIVSRTGWENIAAIRNGKVFNANADEISRPGPRLVDAVKALKEFIDG